MSQKGFFEGQGLNIQMIKQQAQQELGLTGGGSGLSDGKIVLTNEKVKTFLCFSSTGKTTLPVSVPDIFAEVSKIILGGFDVDEISYDKDFDLNNITGKVDFEFSGNGKIGVLQVQNELDTFYPQLINNNFTGTIGYCDFVTGLDMSNSTPPDIFHCGSDEKSYEMFKSTIMNRCNNFNGSSFALQSAFECLAEVLQEDPSFTQDHIFSLQNSVFEEGSKVVIKAGGELELQLFIENENCSLNGSSITTEIINKFSNYKSVNCHMCNYSGSEITFGGKTEFVRLSNLVGSALTTINVNDNMKELQGIDVSSSSSITLNINTDSPIAAFKESIFLPQGSTVNIYGDASDYPNYTQWFNSPLPTINFLPKV